ncbi:hypothetical protein [Sphingopyxis sp.]|uniref:hypothetical protein n=1 Tax=Sphingopyxis sp. TaxID=1908224 RepID=UPI003BA936EE
MIITIYDGPDRCSAESKGVFHFERVPEIGELVVFEDTALTIKHAWHTPAMQHPGAKFAILVSSAEHVAARPRGVEPAVMESAAG